MKRVGPGRTNKVRKRILLADCDAITRAGVIELIHGEPGLEVCGEAATARQALAAIKSLKPDLVLMDFSLPDKSGLELIREIETLYPNVTVLVLSMHEESFFAERVLRAGGRGYVMKREGKAGLLKAIAEVLAGKIYVSGQMSTQLLEGIRDRPMQGARSAVGVLTDREFDVFQLVGEGMTVSEISERLHLSPKTVNTHRLHIKAKLQMETMSQLTKYAVCWAMTAGSP